VLIGKYFQTEGESKPVEISKEEYEEKMTEYFDNEIKKLGIPLTPGGIVPSGKEKEVSAANIKKLKVNYRAGKRILEAMENAPKEKVK